MTPNQSEEIRLNKIYEPKFRKWIECQVLRYGKILLKDAVEAGAEITDASTQTIERYIRKMCSIPGKFQIVEFDGKKYIEYKEWFKAK